MSDLFKELIPAILQTKKNVLDDGDEDSYVPFVVNKALSHHYDCIFWANEMNRRPYLDKKMQFDYLFGKVRGYKRQYVPWNKRNKENEKEESINTLMEYYNYSREKAKVALSILDSEQLDKIKVLLDKGGRVSKTHK